MALSSKIFKGDRTIWVVYFFLCIISIVEVFSAGSSLAYKSGDFFAPLIKQVSFLAAGTVVVLLVSRIPCRYFKILPLGLIPLSVILLFITLFFAEATNDGSRWLNLGPISFQPSEIAKCALILYTALILSSLQTEDGIADKAFKFIMIPTVLICGLIFSENFSTACLLFGVILLMMFVGRIPYKRFGQIIGFFIACGCLGFATLKVLPQNFIDEISILHRADTWTSRLDKFSEDNDDPAKFDLKKNTQVGTANIAIATCNIVGLMPGNSVQRDYLSQAYSDFIFAIIIEELGLWGATLVVFFYIVLIFRAWRIASRCETLFPAFLIIGLAFMLTSQAIINMMVAVGLFPVTGQPLPLISRGGTAMIIFCFYFGMMLSVSISAKQKEEIPAES
ncbi:MAG: FtsW/RodA/SpoVE family cell cycle protein [Bacteroidaceae bacterium]|jgi:cell division protein FtsW|nr:FtsW/RodA/SpoVE family cell cycle protein [Bacteroidaceae bacterium]